VDGLKAALGIGFERSALAMLLLDDDLRVIICANPAAHLLFAADSLIGRVLSEFSTSDRTSKDAWESPPSPIGWTRWSASANS
jgi:hypothetical protein